MMPYTSRETYEFISHQTNDPIVEWKTCKASNQPFPITQKDLTFYEKISPTLNGKKYPIPTPTLCPEERERRRLAFRNERKLYRRKCDFSGREIISTYSPDKQFKVYDQNIWRSDQRNPLDYGRDYDFGKTFRENFKVLMDSVPRLGLNVMNAENSVYNNLIRDCKNCYMLVDGVECEDCYYSRNIRWSKECTDCLGIEHSEHCSNMVAGDHNFDVHFGYDVIHCSRSHFLINCEGCNDCIMCSHLMNQQYCYQNMQYSKETFEEIKKKLNYQMIEEWFTTVLLKGDNKIENKGNEGSTIGNNIRYSKNIIFSDNMFHCVDCKYCQELSKAETCQDCYVGMGKVMYEALGTGTSYQSAFCSYATDNQFCYYCEYCFSCISCFVCTGLKNKQYCIFNKQYEKADYEKLVAQIIEQMQTTGERGEFFNPSLSPFGYNETVANEYYPSPQAEKAGYHRSTYESPQPTAEKILQGKDLPATIEEVSDDILQAVIACEVTGKLFRLQAKELAFYRKNHLPLPRRHSDQRHLERLALRNASGEE